MKKRVVVTGLGMVTPLGLDVKKTWQNVLQGKSGVDNITHFDTHQFSTQIAGCVKNFDASAYLAPKDARKFDIFIQYAMAATHQAIQDAGLVITENNAHRIGVSVGSGIGGLPLIERSYQTLQNGGPRKVSPFFIPSAIINMASGFISIQHGLKGPNISIVTACTTGAHNIGYAMRTIAYGDADIMIAGGTEMATSPLGLAGFSACRALSTRNHEPTKASRPFDQERDGFVLGDGAGILILESYEHARQRGAKIYAEIAGFGMSADAYHITSPQPDGEGFRCCMLNALQDACMLPEKIHYINAHATSTIPGDAAEVLAVQTTFKEHAKTLAVSSTKSMTGHLLGAAGAVEAIFSILALRDQVAPPTINLDNPIDGYDLNFVPHDAQSMKIDACLSNSFGFGGTNGSLIFCRLNVASESKKH